MFPGLLLSATLLAPSADPFPAAQPPDLNSSRPINQTPGAPLGDLVPPSTTPSVLPATPGPQTAMPTTTLAPTVVSPAVMAPPSPLADLHIGPPNRIWTEGAYGRYWISPAKLPVPLLTSNGGVVLGGSDREFGPIDGISFGGGMWLNDRNTIGVGFRGLLLEQKSLFDTVSSAADGSPSLARPFTDALLAQPSSFLVSAPGIASGALATQIGARVSGAEIYAIRNLVYDNVVRLDLTFGARYFDLDEVLSITQSIQPMVMIPVGGVNTAPGSTIIANDRFRTRNQFWGGSMGLRGEYRIGAGFIGLNGAVGFGNNHQVIDIDGSTTVTGGPTYPGAVLTGFGSNLGQNTVNRFAVLSEAGATAGIQFAPWGRALVGYDFLYLNNVVRPGQQIDSVVNTRFSPLSRNFGNVSGISSPVETGTRDDFFVHGVRIGLELLY